LQVLQTAPGEAEAAAIEKPVTRLRQGIGRLIDADAEGTLDQVEAEPRIRAFQERVRALEAEAAEARKKTQQQAEWQLVVGRLEEFGAKVSAGLEHLDGPGRRALIRTLVKRVEIGQETVRVVFRVEDLTPPSGQEPVLQDCGRREGPPLRSALEPFLISPILPERRP
jgi:site-specific DNA recombinase